jgi:hypothetical protein
MAEPADGRRMAGNLKNQVCQRRREKTSKKARKNKLCHVRENMLESLHPEIFVCREDFAE